MSTAETAGKRSITSDAVVTARIPKGIKQRGDAALKRIGATPTKLVNAAYAYVLEHGELPGYDEGHKELAPGMRRLSGEQAKRLRKQMKRTMLPVTIGDDHGRLREETMRERYAEYLDAVS